MTNEQINIAIAEACGMRGVWGTKITSCGCDGQWDYFNPQGNRLPDYCNDLNAMHEAEKVLTEPQQATYAQLLHAAHKRHYLLADFCVAHATAAQRATPFLKTINKWEGGSDDN
jgi:hypothetical protein